MAERNVDVDENGNVSNKFKLAMAFNIWRVLDKDAYKKQFDYIDENKWVLFTLVMMSYRKLIYSRKKSAQSVVSEIAWATGYIIPETMNFRFCGYDLSAVRHPLKDKYVITANILKNSIDIDTAYDDGEEGSVLYELKKLPLSCWLNLKDTIKKYNKTWEEDIRTNLYKWMGLGYEYVLDFYSFMNICAYHQIATEPLKDVWERYMRSAVQNPLIYIAKDFPEYRTFWTAWYDELYRYSYEMFDLAEISFNWDSAKMQERKNILVQTGLWADFSNSRGSTSVNKNDIVIDARNFAEKWLEKPLEPSGRELEFHGFFTSKNRGKTVENNGSSPARQANNISIDEIRDIIDITRTESPEEELMDTDREIRQENLALPEQKKSSFMDTLKNWFAWKPKEEEPQQQEEPPEIRRKNKYLEVLNESADNPVFRSEIEVTKEHIEQIQTRLQKLNDILTSHFKPHEMTYKRFKNIIEDAATRFYANVKTMVKRINIFDTKDYFRISDGNVNMSVSAKQERLKIYTEHINYVKKIVEANENIISKLDMLLLELTKLDDFSEEALNNNAAINELNDLIDQTKFYKQ